MGGWGRGRGCTSVPGRPWGVAAGATSQPPASCRRAWQRQAGSRPAATHLAHRHKRVVTPGFRRRGPARRHRLHARTPPARVSASTTQGRGAQHMASPPRVWAPWAARSRAQHRPTCTSPVRVSMATRSPSQSQASGSSPPRPAEPNPMHNRTVSGLRPGWGAWRAGRSWRGCAGCSQPAAVPEARREAGASRGRGAAPLRRQQGRQGPATRARALTAAGAGRRRGWCDSAGWGRHAGRAGATGFPTGCTPARQEVSEQEQVAHSPGAKQQGQPGIDACGSPTPLRIFSCRRRRPPPTPHPAKSRWQVLRDMTVWMWLPEQLHAAAELPVRLPLSHACTTVAVWYARGSKGPLGHRHCQPLLSSRQTSPYSSSLAENEWRVVSSAACTCQEHACFVFAGASHPRRPPTITMPRSRVTHEAPPARASGPPAFRSCASSSKLPIRWTATKGDMLGLPASSRHQELYSIRGPSGGGCGSVRRGGTARASQAGGSTPAGGRFLAPFYGSED